MSHAKPKHGLGPILFASNLDDRDAVQTWLDFPTKIVVYMNEHSRVDHQRLADILVPVEAMGLAEMLKFYPRNH